MKDPVTQPSAPVLRLKVIVNATVAVHYHAHGGGLDVVALSMTIHVAMICVNAYGPSENVIQNSV